MLTPWFFEIGRLAWDVHSTAIAVVLFLVALERVRKKEKWTWPDAVLIAGGLAFLTYTYNTGRILGPLFAYGLLLFWRQLAGVFKTWILYALTILPLVNFHLAHPGVSSRRFWETTCFDPAQPLYQQINVFAMRFLEDQSLHPLLVDGDTHLRHHVPNSGGPFLFSIFLLSFVGILIASSSRLSEPWWRFALYALAISIVPGAITNQPFHEIYLMSYCVLLFIFTIPALQWLFVPRPLHFVALWFLVLGTLVQAYFFQTVFWRDGRSDMRQLMFEGAYKQIMDEALTQKKRPIYLETGTWGPAYMHAYWYATVEGESIREFQTLAVGQSPPQGAIVLSSNSDCAQCRVIEHGGLFLLYEKL